MEDNIFGCFVSATQPYCDATQEAKELALINGRLFRSYIWGEKGICDKLEKLQRENYGEDLRLALFQFYVNPLLVEVQNIKTIEDYRKREKAVGIPIIINEGNFFSKSEEERNDFLKQSILEKFELLADVVKRRKLDTKVDMLRADLLKIMNW